MAQPKCGVREDCRFGMDQPPACPPLIPGRSSTMRLLSFLLLFLALAAGQSFAEEKFTFKTPAGLKPVPVPANNPLTQAKIELGKQLYFDARLSQDNTVSCASCHDPAKGWSNGESVATGIGGQKGGRSAPAIANAAYQKFQFWDGRALELEGQALGPIQNPIEMNMKLTDVIPKINKIDGYRRQFQEVFGGEATSEHVAQAIASFERTVLSGDAPF